MNEHFIRQKLKTKAKLNNNKSVGRLEAARKVKPIEAGSLVR